jgi:AraC-like DNA-binding protein
MLKRQASNVDKSALVRWINQDQRQTLVLESKSKVDDLIEGELVSYKLSDGFSVQGGNTNELRDFQVIATAKKALIIVILLEGELDFSYDDLRLEFDASSEPVAVNLTSPVAFRRTLRERNRVCKLNIVVPHQWIEQRVEEDDKVGQFIENHLATFKIDISDHLLELTREIIELHTPKGILAKLKMESLVQALLGLVFGQIDQHIYSAPVQLNIERSKTERSLDELATFIETNLDRELSTEELATYTNMSESNMRKKFKQAFGASIQGYIRRRRLEIAHQNLERGVASISEVAYNAGYRYPSNFTIAFKKAFGFPPETLLNHPKTSP